MLTDNYEDQMTVREQDVEEAYLSDRLAGFARELSGIGSERLQASDTRQIKYRSSNLGRWLIVYDRNITRAVINLNDVAALRLRYPQ